MGYFFLNFQIKFDQIFTGDFEESKKSVEQARTMKHQIEVGAIETINETQKELEQARGGDQECGLRACMVSSPWLLCGVVARLRQSSAGHFLGNSKTEKYCVHVRIAVWTFCSINVIYAERTFPPRCVGEWSPLKLNHRLLLCLLNSGPSALPPVHPSTPPTPILSTHPTSKSNTSNKHK